MNTNFKNLVLYIESEQMLEDVKNILIQNGQESKLKGAWLMFSPVKTNNYLGYSDVFNCWSLFYKLPTDTVISLSEFKELIEK